MNSTKRNNPKFAIIGIGASAGGLGEFKTFFKNLNTKYNLSFIIVQHLDPERESNLANIIKNYTKLEVSPAEDNLRIKNKQVYIIPPNKRLLVKNGRIHLEKFEESRGHRYPIDILFRSLAGELKEKSIGILLSGTGTDGTLGIRKIKGEGGMVMVQDPKTTEYNGMLFNAINNVDVDFILPTDEMPKELIKYIDFSYGTLGKKEEISKDKVEKLLDKIFRLIYSTTGYEFSIYKTSTLLRRIERRMTINQINSLEHFIELLEKDNKEIIKLSHELFINVTHFFRDKDIFEIIEDEVISKIIQRKNNGSKIRVWVPACSTGEEAYSIAILLKKYLKNNKKQIEIQIFATDIDENSIKLARKGIYNKNIITDIREDLFDEFFKIEKDKIIISKEIRKSIIFAKQNVINDPPFSNMDIISCRNLLIYLKHDIQFKLLKLFHYALKENGFLILGNSETLGNAEEFYEAVNRNAKIFQAKKLTKSQLTSLKPHFPPFFSLSKKNTKHNPSLKQDDDRDYQKVMKNTLWEEYIPSSLLVNQQFEVLYIHGKMGKFLEYESGKPSLNIKEMIRKEIKSQIITTLKRCEEKKGKVLLKSISFSLDAQEVVFDLRVHYISAEEAGEILYLLIFAEKETEPHVLSEEKPQNLYMEDFNNIRVKQLENELKSTKEQLKATINELEATNQELKSTNEEYLSANEELKSTNEELQTSKEELQSVNEELVTVNDELQTKIEELSKTNDDLQNFIQSTEIGTLFLDRNLKIRRFTPSTKDLFRLRDSDLGRPLNDISSKIKNNKILEYSKEVIEKLDSIERDIQTEGQKWYRMRINPYKTQDNTIEGVVVTFMDITERKKTEQSLEQSEAKFRDAYNQLKIYEDLFRHDMTNILQVNFTSIGTILNLYENETISQNEDIVDLLHISLEQVKRGFKLIKNIQRLSHGGPTDFKIQPINLNLILENSIQNVKNMFPNQDIKFYIKNNSEDIPVKASSLMEDVLDNIFSNAVRYNNETKKKIWVYIKNISKKGESLVQIDIADNGIGISDDLKDKLFTQQIKSISGKGMGIGLTIVKKIIDSFEGKIAIEDHKENNKVIGSRFVILLKRKDNS